MMRTNENIVSSYFYYMWNRWSKKECEAVFRSMSIHFWEKWRSLSNTTLSGAAERFYAELGNEARRKIVERACELYDGSKPVSEKEEIAPQEPYRCTNCGSPLVQHKARVRPNNGHEYIDDAWESESDECGCRCEYCGGYHVIKPHCKFMEDIDYWFSHELQPDDPEVITGLCESDYPSAEAYDTAVAAYWNALDDEQKIHCWKALTYDKRSSEM